MLLCASPDRSLIQGGINDTVKESLALGVVLNKEEEKTT